MQVTERLIKNVEAKWLRQLQEHCRTVFKNVHLPSHDETHHTRVWMHAKSLLTELAKKGHTFNEVEVEKLILAVYFHDTGMSESLQKDHGQISRRMAKEYLKGRDVPGPELDEIYNAIEHHDRKDYRISGAENTPEYNLQVLLNICDDLDALGFVGAYRYAEIYLLRNIAVNDISDAVLENLQRRFQHMKAYLGFSPHYLKAQHQRYMVTRNFFKDLNFQIKHVGDDLSNNNGPLGIINMLKDLVMDQKLHIAQAAQTALMISADFYITNFFEKLEKEI